jgi:hypothetical protein
MGVRYKESQGQTKRTVELQEEEEEGLSVSDHKPLMTNDEGGT